MWTLSNSSNKKKVNLDWKNLTNAIIKQFWWKSEAQIKKNLGKFQTNTTIPEMGFDRHCVKPLSLRSKIN